MVKLTDAEAFAREFLNKYVEWGFGRLTKRDTDVLVFYLLIKDGIYKMPRDLYRASRDLALSETRVRNLYQDVQLRYMQYTEQEAVRKLVEIVEAGSIERKGEKITFIIRDPLLRQYFEEWVAQHDGFTDSSFNKNLVVVGQDTLAHVLATLTNSDLSTIQSKLPEELSELKEKTSLNELFAAFAQEFARSAGKQAGAASIAGITAGLKAIVMG